MTPHPQAWQYRSTRVRAGSPVGGVPNDPTAQRFPSSEAATPSNSALLLGLGLGMTAQVLPSQCSTSVRR